MSRACWFDREINPSYLELARHYGTAILPTRIANKPIPPLDTPLAPEPGRINHKIKVFSVSRRS